MRFRVSLAAALFVLLVVPVALAGPRGDAGDPRATASASVKKKIKKLKKEVNTLKQELEGVQGQVAELEGAPGTPSGPAGGALTGSYPNPEIAPGAVGSSQVANRSLVPLDFSTAIPAAHVTRSAAQSIPDDNLTALAFDSERYDTAGMHDAAANSRLKAPVAGIYAVTAQVEWESVPGGGCADTFIRSVRLLKNSAVPIALDWGVEDPEGCTQELTTQVKLQAGEFVEVVVFQESGGNANSDVRQDFQHTPEFSMAWVAPGPGLPE